MQSGDGVFYLSKWLHCQLLALAVYLVNRRSNVVALGALAKCYRLGASALLLFSLLMAHCSVSATPAEGIDPLRVTMIMPVESAFQTNMATVAQLAAADLSIQLTIVYSDGTLATLMRLGQEAISQRVDGLIFTPVSEIGEALITQAQQHHIPVVTIRSGGSRPSPAKLAQLTNYIANVTMDDEKSGQLLMQSLVATQANEVASPSVLLIAGPQGHVNVERGVQDIERFVDSVAGTLQTGYTDWSAAQALAHYDAALATAPNIVVGMGPEMALAVAEKSHHLLGQRAPVVGSMIWSEHVGQAMVAGKIQAAIAGSQFSGAIGLTILFDHLMQGKDTTIRGSYVTPLVVITAVNEQEYAPILNYDPLRLDFRRLSRYFNPALPSNELRLADLMPNGAREQFLQSLTPQELAFLRQQPLIRVGVEPDGAPIDFITPEGKHAGLMADYLTEIAKLVPIRFD
ncbi:MAG: substrate-binding domain-containing protein, partial [Shewanella sp.]